VAPQARTIVSVQALADCPYSIAQEYAEDYLRRAEAGGPEATIRVPWPFPLPLRQRVTLSFGVHSDVLEEGRPHDEMRVNWRSGSPLLPDFRGTVRFRIDGNRTRVLVDGGYLPPLGVLGRLFDVVLGRFIARAGLQDGADRLARHLTERERAWRAAHPPS
jgi:hypothetical protein